MLGIIGGSGFYELDRSMEKHTIITPYGDADVFFGKINGKGLAFIPRHGVTHDLPPHKVNYKANVYAMKKIGVSAAFATYAAGIIAKYKPGDIVVLEDFISFHTPITFIESFSTGVKHPDMSEPFNHKLSENLQEAAAIHDIRLKTKGVIATTIGPRLETRAEIAALKKLGANLVNMTSAYEVTLFNELEIPFAAVAVGTNYATGLGKGPVLWADVIKGMKKSENELRFIAKELVRFVNSD